jgi:hypothetical protein
MHSPCLHYKELRMMYLTSNSTCGFQISSDHYKYLNEKLQRSKRNNTCNNDNDTNDND